MLEEFKHWVNSDILPAAMETRLPKLVDPARLAAKQETIAGKLAASRVSRLATLYDVADAVEASLKFSRAGYGRLNVSGELSAILKAQCQRCLQPVSLEITHDIDVSIVDLDVTEEIAGKTQTEDFDDALEYRSKLDIHELVEDELVLASPIIPQHERGECVTPDGGRSTENDFTSGAGAASSNKLNEHALEKTGENGTTTRPFAGLADLLSSKD